MPDKSVILSERKRKYQKAVRKIQQPENELREEKKLN